MSSKQGPELQYPTVGNSEHFDRGGFLAAYEQINPSQVFVTGYYVSEQGTPDIHLRPDDERVGLQSNGKMKISDRTTGTGPRVTEASVVNIRYEIRTTGEVVVDSNRRSNAHNNNLVSVQLSI